MGFIHDVEKGLRVLLTNMRRPEDREAIVRYCKEKIFESYRNGQEAAAVAAGILRNAAGQERRDGRNDRHPSRTPVTTTATVCVPRDTRRRQQR